MGVSLHFSAQICSAGISKLQSFFATHGNTMKTSIADRQQKQIDQFISAKV
jgi:hypothetical protein